MIKTDGNGSFIINNKVAISLGLVLVIIGALMTFTVQATTYKSNVDYLMEHSITKEEVMSKEIISDMRLKIIQEDIEEIKEDIDFIREKMENS